MVQLAKDYGILKHYPAIQSVKAALSERSVRTIKHKIYKYVHDRKDKRYIDNLQDIVRGINGTYSRALKMAPAEVTVEKQPLVFNSLYPKWYTTDYGGYWNLAGRRKRPFLLKKGDIVRKVKLYDKTFYKAYRETFSKQLYSIVGRVPRFPPMYQLAELEEDGEVGETISGNYYGAELVKVLVKKKRNG
jgi:hypothetical protein